MSEPPSLYELALLQCQRFATSVTDIGDLPYRIVRPWLAKVGRDQLAVIEERSPHIIDESDELWKDIIAREFKDRKLPQSDFRKAYYAFQRDKEEQLGQARERLKLKQEQYNQNKRASSVVTLSEADLPIRGPGTQTPTFRSSMMRSVVKKSQATSGLFGRSRAPPRLVPAQPRRSMSPPLYQSKHVLPSKPTPSTTTSRARQAAHLGSPPMSPPPVLSQQQQYQQQQQHVQQQQQPDPQSTSNSEPQLNSASLNTQSNPRIAQMSRHTSPEASSPPALYSQSRRPYTSVPPAKRKRVASVFMPRR